jgi:hypothetical protein
MIYKTILIAALLSATGAQAFDCVANPYPEATFLSVCHKNYGSVSRPG